MRKERRSSRPTERRGQTTLDFAIGVSVFLVAVAFVLAFVPGMVQPFEANTQEEMAVADRVATQLATGSLGGTDPYVVDAGCTVDFFRQDATGEPDCPFKENDLDAGGTLPGRLGVASKHDVRVRIQSDLDDDGGHQTLCWDGEKGQVVEQSDPACDGGTGDVVLEIDTGTPPDATGSVNTGERVVSLRGYDVRLLVQVW